MGFNQAWVHFSGGLFFYYDMLRTKELFKGYFYEIFFVMFGVKIVMNFLINFEVIKHEFCGQIIQKSSFYFCGTSINFYIMSP